MRKSGPKSAKSFCSKYCASVLNILENNNIMWEDTSGTVRRDSWKGRFQPPWCSSQQTFLSQTQDETQQINECTYHQKLMLYIMVANTFFTYLPLWSPQMHYWVYIYCKRYHSISNQENLWLLKIWIIFVAKCPRAASVNTNSNSLGKWSWAQIFTPMTQCHSLWLWQRTETCPFSWCQPILHCCQWHQSG